MHQRFTSAIALLLFVSVGLACSFLRPKPALTWHVLLEIDASMLDDASLLDKETAVRRTVSIIERRLEAAGIHTSSVLAQGTPPNGRILISLPDVPDRERVTGLITSQGTLELTGVVSPPNPSPVQTYSTEKDALASFGGSAPGSRRVLPYMERAALPTDEQSSEGRQQPTSWVVVESTAIVNGSELRNAQAIQRGVGEDYQISFSLGPEGAMKFGTWTEAHINDYLGVVINGEVKSIAYIKSPIFDQGEISGRFTKHSAEDLALILRSGGLPAPVKIIEEGNNK